MSIHIRYRCGTPLKGQDVVRVLRVTCETCGIEFIFNCTNPLRQCPACDNTLPKRIKYLPGYHSARLRYYANK